MDHPPDTPDIKYSHAAAEVILSAEKRAKEEGRNPEFQDLFWSLDAARLAAYSGELGALAADPSPEFLRFIEAIDLSNKASSGSGIADGSAISFELVTDYYQYVISQAADFAVANDTEIIFSYLVLGAMAAITENARLWVDCGLPESSHNAIDHDFASHGRPGFEADEKLLSEAAFGPKIPQRFAPSFSLWIDPGGASVDDVTNLFEKVSALHRACGGSGLIFAKDNSNRPVVPEFSR